MVIEVAIAEGSPSIVGENECLSLYMFLMNVSNLVTPRLLVCSEQELGCTLLYSSNLIFGVPGLTVRPLAWPLLFTSLSVFFGFF